MGHIGGGGGTALLTATFVAFEGAFAYSAMLPSLMTMATFVDSAEKIRSIREGEIVATAFAGLFATVISMILGNWLPLILTTVACVFMLLVYEWGLRRAPAWGAQ